jgi:hypothetical protein
VRRTRLFSRNSAKLELAAASVDNQSHRHVNALPGGAKDCVIYDTKAVLRCEAHSRDVCVRMGNPAIAAEKVPSKLSLYHIQCNSGRSEISAEVNINAMLHPESATSDCGEARRQLPVKRRDPIHRVGVQSAKIDSWKGI